MAENSHLKLFSKIEALKDDQIDLLNKFIDVFLEFNSKHKVERIDHILKLTDEVNEYAYSHGMSKELANKLIDEIS